MKKKKNYHGFIGVKDPWFPNKFLAFLENFLGDLARTGKGTHELLSGVNTSILSGVDLMNVNGDWLL